MISATETQQNLKEKWNNEQTLKQIEGRDGRRGSRAEMAGVRIAGDRLVGGGSRGVEESNAGTCHCQNSERYSLSLIYIKK